MLHILPAVVDKLYIVDEIDVQSNEHKYLPINFAFFQHISCSRSIVSKVLKMKTDKWYDAEQK